MTKHIDVTGNFVPKQRKKRNKNLQRIDDELTPMLILMQSLDDACKLLSDIKSRIINEQELPESFAFVGVSPKLDKVVTQKYFVVRCLQCDQQTIIGKQGRKTGYNIKRFCSLSCRAKYHRRGPNHA